MEKNEHLYEIFLDDFVRYGVNIANITKGVQQKKRLKITGKKHLLQFHLSYYWKPLDFLYFEDKSNPSHNVECRDGIWYKVDTIPFLSLCYGMIIEENTDYRKEEHWHYDHPYVAAITTFTDPNKKTLYTLFRRLPRLELNFKSNIPRWQ